MGSCRTTGEAEALLDRDIDGAHELTSPILYSPSIGCMIPGMLCSLVTLPYLATLPHQEGSAAAHPNDSYVYTCLTYSSPLTFVAFRSGIPHKAVIHMRGQACRQRSGHRNLGRL